MNEQPFSDLIRALARADWDAVDALVVKIGQQGLANGLRIVGAAFALAVNRRFGPDSSPTDVAQWVAGIRAQHQGAEPLPALEMEGLIRAALGEPELVDTIAPETALGAELFILGQILLELNPAPAEMDEFIADAEQLAAEQLS
ncbi:hypothetical protein O3597_04995 [Verrucosispora sp. WMMA2044]|uniref:hypothetical protein n=1 Tax=Verrucosispora sp. WMMA2044 TaxID=3016419 RepID=UPI00248BA2A8|nr:hypothetical protein [Verrucosispora sp. WMMA2044]WBB49839.1 hypothetical protein O3597_04995 [Verrucosispora sp. WMMA2044]